MSDVNDKRVEAVARFLFEDAGYVWETTSELARDGFRKQARAVLAAADAVLPPQAAPSGEAVAVIGRDWQFLWASGDAIVDIVKRHDLKIGTKLYTHPAPAPSAVPAGMKLVPDWKGYALLGSGRYLLDNSSPPADPDLGPELIITLASEKDREGREIGERRDSPARVIQPEEMVIRIGFLNERGLFALEDQLRILREEHWPETVAPAPSDVPAGFVLVPVEPTKAMLIAAAATDVGPDADGVHRLEPWLTALYAAMLSAAPPPPNQQSGGKHAS